MTIQISRQIQGIVGLSLAQITLGTLGVCVVESGLDSLSVVFYRCLIGAAVLAVYCFVFCGDWLAIRRMPRRALLQILASGALMVVNWVLFFEGIRRTGIAVATIVFHVQPFILLLLGALVFREGLRPVVLGWLAVALGGLVLATGLSTSGEEVTQDYVIGLVCTLGAALAYSVVTILVKGIGQVKSRQVTLIQCAFGALLLLPLGPVTPLFLESQQWAWLLVVGAVHTGGVYMLLYGALPKLTTALIAVLLFFYPASAVIVDALVYGRVLSLLQVAGLVLILLASLGVTLRWGEGRKAAFPS